MTVRCVDGILNIVPAPDEGADNLEHQINALREAVGTDRDAAAGVKMVFSDRPEGIDDERWVATFPNLTCVAKDPLHPALAIEKPSREKPTAFSKKVRRCLAKFRIGTSDAAPFYRKGAQRMAVPTLSRCMNAMSVREAEARHREIIADGYDLTACSRGEDFLKDIAALCKVSPEAANVRIKGSATILGSLAHTTRAQGLEYLMNCSRFVQRHPGEIVQYGTTGNEAFHNQLKAWFRNVFVQTARNAILVCSVACFSKLIASTLQRCDLTREYGEHELLTLASGFLRANNIEFQPAVEIVAQDYPEVDLDALPKSAKRLRKQPGHR